jgi:hypothetical protein
MQLLEETHGHNGMPQEPTSSATPETSRSVPMRSIHDSQTDAPFDPLSVDKDVSRHLTRSDRLQMPPDSSKPNRRAIIGSTILHTFLILLLALLWKPITKGTGGDRDRPIGIAVASQKVDGVQYELQSGGGSQSKSSDAELAQAISQASTNSSTIDATMDQLLGPLASALQGIEASNGAAAGLGDAGLSGTGTGGDSRGTGTKSKTSFMGVEGQGNSFVYVVDYSESMTEYNGTPMQRAKDEIGNSLRTLSRINQFQIIFYNEKPSKYYGSLNNTGGLIFANDVEREAAARYVQSINPIGGTEHYRALLVALDLLPDVIFFLTDATQPRLSSSQLDRIISKAEGNQTTIHTIQFGSGLDQSEGSWIEQLANRSRGKFRYVDVSKF